MPGKRHLADVEAFQPKEQPQRLPKMNAALSSRAKLAVNVTNQASAHRINAMLRKLADKDDASVFFPGIGLFGPELRMAHFMQKVAPSVLEQQEKKRRRIEEKKQDKREGQSPAIKKSYKKKSKRQ